MNKIDNLKIAKKYCKEFKYKFEDIYNDLFIVSCINKRKVSNKNYVNFDKWQIIKNRSFTAIQIMPDKDCVIIKNKIGGILPVNTKLIFNSTIIDNLKEFKI